MSRGIIKALWISVIGGLYLLYVGIKATLNERKCNQKIQGEFVDVRSFDGEKVKSLFKTYQWIFKYVVDGQEYICASYNHFTVTTRKFKEIMSRGEWVPGVNYTILIDPDNPEKFTFNRKEKLNGYTWSGIVFLVLALIMFLFFFVALGDRNANGSIQAGNESVLQGERIENATYFLDAAITPSVEGKFDESKANHGKIEVDEDYAFHLSFGKYSLNLVVDSCDSAQITISGANVCEYDVKKNKKGQTINRIHIPCDGDFTFVPADVDLVDAGYVTLHFSCEVIEKDENVLEKADPVVEEMKDIITTSSQDKGENAPKDQDFDEYKTKAYSLYSDIANAVLKSIQTGVDSQNEEYSYMYAQFGSMASSNFAYGRLDINDDGLDEFFLGESGTNEFPCVIYDIYTVVDGKIVHLFSGGARNRMYFTDTTNVLLNEWSNGADSSWSQYVQLVDDKLKPVELVRPAEKVNYELVSFL